MKTYNYIIIFTYIYLFMCQLVESDNFAHILLYKYVFIQIYLLNCHPKEDIEINYLFMDASINSTLLYTKM